MSRIQRIVTTLQLERVNLLPDISETWLASRMPLKEVFKGVINFCVHFPFYVQHERFFVTMWSVNHIGFLDFEKLRIFQGLEKFVAVLWSLLFDIDLLSLKY
jgi:hypothetical protein